MVLSDRETILQCVYSSVLETVNGFLNFQQKTIHIEIDSECSMDYSKFISKIERL